MPGYNSADPATMSSLMQEQCVGRLDALRDALGEYRRIEGLAKGRTPERLDAALERCRERAGELEQALGEVGLLPGPY